MAILGEPDVHRSDGSRRIPQDVFGKIAGGTKRHYERMAGTHIELSSAGAAIYVILAISIADGQKHWRRNREAAISGPAIEYDPGASWYEP